MATDQKKKPARRKKPKNWRTEFLASLAMCGNVSSACADAGVARAVAYRARDDDDDFRGQWLEAIDVAVEDLEAEARRRARHGVPEDVYWKGEVVGSIQRYSDGLLMFLLKANNPAKYREPKGDINAHFNFDAESRAADPEAVKAALAAASAVSLKVMG